MIHGQMNKTKDLRAVVTGKYQVEE